jgi:hypothetical protein
MADPSTRCEGCGRELPPANMALHSLRCAGVLSPGTPVYYIDQTTGSHIAAVVTSIDKSLVPPGYTIKLGESERETERSRLVVNLPTGE